jgi:hypothetical protein
VRGCALGIATRVTGAVFCDGRGRCSFGQHAHAARAHGAVREDRETSGQRMRRQPHLSACRTGCRAARFSQLRVNSQRATNTLGTLRRALEHSADYAGPAAAKAAGPDSRRSACARASITQSRMYAGASSRDRLRIISALCLGGRPKPPSRGMGGSSAPRATVLRFQGTNIIRRPRPAPLPAPRHPRRRAAPRRSRSQVAPPPHRERSRAPTATCRAHAPSRGA